MKLSNSFIAVKKITSSVPRSNFSEDELNRVAELIIKVEGIINPLVLRRTNLQSYEVVDGHFEYYAATRAKEIDSQKGEYIGAFVMELENTEVIQEQVEMLRKQKYGDQDINKKFESLTNQVTDLAESVKRIENILSEAQQPKRSTQSKPKTKKSAESEYDSMTVTKLKAIAKERKIEGYSKMNKAQLIAIITSNSKV